MNTNFIVIGLTRPGIEPASADTQIFFDLTSLLNLSLLKIFDTFCCLQLLIQFCNFFFFFASTIGELLKQKDFFAKCQNLLNADLSVWVKTLYSFHFANPFVNLVSFATEINEFSRTVQFLLVIDCNERD